MDIRHETSSGIFVLLQLMDVATTIVALNLGAAEQIRLSDASWRSGQYLD